MNLGNSLFHARKKSGLSQEEVAEKIGVSRQTISKWETNETVPDIYQSKKMAKLYKISLDELIGRRTLITEESSYEQQILNVVETMDDTKKELSLRLLNEVAQQRGDKDGE